MSRVEYFILTATIIFCHQALPGWFHLFSSKVPKVPDGSQVT